MTKIESAIQIVAEKAKQHPTEPEYWIQGWDEGQDFCYDCAEKKLAELKLDPVNKDRLDILMVDGGWGSESDSQDSCETCGVSLKVCLTDAGVEYELDHFEENGFDLTSTDDCYCLQQVLESCPYSQELQDRIEKLAQRILDTKP